MSVAELMAQRLPNTVLLVVGAYSIILVARSSWDVHRGPPVLPFDHVVTTLAFIGISIPSFWLGLLLLIFFAVQTRNLGLPYFPGWRHVRPGSRPHASAGSLAPGAAVDHAGHRRRRRLHPLRARLHAGSHSPGLRADGPRQRSVGGSRCSAATRSRTRLFHW